MIGDAEAGVRSDEQRAALGFLTTEQTDALADDGVVVLDPASTLISRSVRIAAGTIVYPTVIVAGDAPGVIAIGEECVLYPGAVLQARGGGRISVGAGVELGPGGVVIRAGASESTTLGEQVRLTGGCELTGNCELGRGAQILGAISARSVRLGGGRGGHRWPSPDERGAVLKGAGVADGVALAMGEVRSRRPSFADAPTERQSAHHPAALRPRAPG